MEPPSIKFGSYMKGQATKDALGSHGAFKHVARGMHESSKAKKCVWIPIFSTKSWRLNAKTFALGLCWSFWAQNSKVQNMPNIKTFCLGPFTKPLNLELESSKTYWTQFSCIQPPTFKIESWRLSAKQFALAPSGVFELQVQKFTNMPKSKKLLQPLYELLILELGSSNKCQTQVSCA